MSILAVIVRNRLPFLRFAGLTLGLVVAALSPVVRGEPATIDAREFIEAYAKQQGIDVVIDPRLKGRVTIFSELTPGHISAEEFYSALLAQNFSAIEIDGTMRVLQSAVAKHHKLPSFDGRNRNELAPSQIVKSVLKLRVHSAEKLAEDFRALIPLWGYIKADSKSNSLIIVGTVNSIEQIVELIDELS